MLKRFLLCHIINSKKLRAGYLLQFTINHLDFPETVMNPSRDPSLGEGLGENQGGKVLENRLSKPYNNFI